jgi:hypothetical protein
VGVTSVTAVLRLDDGVGVQLGPVLARAGEGTIYGVVGRDDWAVKIFHPDLKELHVKRAKVAAMAASPPPGAVQADGFVVLTWPLHVIDGDGASVGYIMRRVDTSDAVEIHTVSNPSNRANPLASAPQWTRHASWQHLVNVAANLCLAVDTVHRVDAVIGDFQERNILVNDTTRVTLVDCDSMQFTAAGGHQFLCGVGRPEFTAPELAGVDLAVTARQQPSDLFALAVHIHLLLMAGNHPFLRGQWAGGGEQPDAMTLARAGHWAGGLGSPLRTHPLAPSVDFLPDRIQRLFVRAFTDGAGDPSSRPSAAEWRSALQDLTVRSCVRGHQVPVETEQCPWCRIDDERAARKRQRASAAGAGQAQTIFKVRPTSASTSSVKSSPSNSFSSVPYVAPPHSGPAPSVGVFSGNGAKIAVGAAGIAVALIALIAIIIAVSGNQTTTASSSATSDPTTYDTATGGTTSSITTTTQAPLDENSALEQLRELASSDRAYINANLGDRWIPQLSSKRPGVVDDGLVYNNVLILQEHMRLRQQYDAKLVWAGDWSTFDEPDWWITIVPVPFDNAEGALGWCLQNNLDADHCYAKLISTTHPVDGSTAHNS